MSILIELDLKSIRSLLIEGDFDWLREWDLDLLRLIEIKDWLNKGKVHNKKGRKKLKQICFALTSNHVK